MRTRLAIFSVVASLAAVLVGAPPGHTQSPTAVNRAVEPVILQGALLPAWARLPAQGQANPYPSGAIDEVRDAHNGTLFVPTDTVDGSINQGVDVSRLAAFRWNATTESFEEVPVQVDQRFPYFLANGRSDFGIYSGTDEELTYQWDIESWKKVAGECVARYPNQPGEEDPSIYAGFPTQDPVPTLDHDDEIVFMASDAGPDAPIDAPAPPGAIAERYEIGLNDPLTGADTYVYLFQRPGGSSFNGNNGYVNYRRDADADEWIDRHTFSDDDPEELGTSNTGYGPNLPGTVCETHPSKMGQFGISNSSTPRPSTDRFPRDGTTVSTEAYQWRASGRWMVRSMRVRTTAAPVPGCHRVENLCPYGPDLVDRWKGRAFQQSPDSDISAVGFEDEQVNWEANSALLGERMGPVRAIRETWGADSGTNVTKREYFYRDLVVNRYFLRVHPIPPDGLYTSWDHNDESVAKYYNEQTIEGVPVDGINDENVGNVDQEAAGQQTYFDATDPTFSRPISIFNWEQIAGEGTAGSLVYMFQLNNIQGAEHPDVIPYYRDDACFDDGTGDDPAPRIQPGDRLPDSEKPCVGGVPVTPRRQACYGCHGLHFLITSDTDNAWTTKPTTEVDGQQYQWAAPTSSADMVVGDGYANTVKFALAPSPVFLPGAPPADPSPTQSAPAPASSGPSTGPSAGPSGPTAPGSTPSGAPGATSGPTPPGGSGGPGSFPSPGASVQPSSSPAGGTGGGAGGSTPTPSPSASPGGPSQTPVAESSLEAARRRVRFGRPVVLSGRLSVPQRCDGPFGVAIYRQGPGEEFFSEVTRVEGLNRTAPWTARVRSGVNANYVAQPLVGAGCTGAFSQSTLVKVSAVVSAVVPVRCDGGFTVRGRVRPARPGSRVFLFRRGETMRPLDRARLDGRSRFSLDAPRCGTYRILWPGTRGNSAGHLRISS
ncbi:MAG TPA: hypothetical protein VNC78_04760 [Actinomycetota bacterium]|nr:hypothetical protein [Actinomycetota bacterium]